MSVRNAVTLAEEARQAPTVAQVIREAIERQTPGLQAVLPKALDSERFSRLVLTAVKATPDLIRCFETQQGQTSVLLAAMQLATVGLEPNTATQDAWLLPRKRNNVWECQASYGYRGLLKLARRSGQIQSVFAEVVRAGDEFEYRRDLDGDVLRHRPHENAEEGDLTHAYAVVRYTNGGRDFVVLSRAKVEAHRAQSDSWKNSNARPYSPWTKWPDEMWKKTALRALAKTMPLEAEAADAAASDERTYTVTDGVLTATYEPTDEPEPPALPEGNPE